MLVAGGQFHDFDYARLEILKLLSADEGNRVTVASDYTQWEALDDCTFLITYTCNVIPTQRQQAALADFVAGGGRWLALHGTNAALDRRAPLSGMDTPPVFGEVANVLGSQFLSHPPIGRYTVDVCAPAHPLVRGIDAFDTDDELYLMRLHEPEKHTTLLETTWTGDTGAERFPHHDWTDQSPRPVMYLRPYGSGEVLYFTLGHCRGHYDMLPELDYWPRVDRGSWEIPEFRELLSRSVRWATGGIQSI